MKEHFIASRIVILALVGVLCLHSAIWAEEGESLVPVRVGKVVRTVLHGYEIAYGRVQADPEARVIVGAPADGIVNRVACRPGQDVSPGDLLFELDARVQNAAVAERKQALEFARSEFERQKQLLEIEGTTQKEYLQAQMNLNKVEQELTAAQVQLDYLSVRAPMMGTITTLNVSAGETVQTAQVLATLIDPFRRTVSMQVPAQAMDEILIGQPVEVSTGTGWIAAGTIDFMATVVNPANGTIEVRATLPSNSPLRIGQFIRARILFETHSGCLAVPTEALVTDPDGGTYIAVIEGDISRRLPVVGKLREGAYIEVEGDNLAEGMTIATEGAYGLPEQTRVQVIGR